MNDKLDPVIDLVSELNEAFNASPKPVLVALDALKRSGMTQEKATSYINSEYPKLQRLMSRGRDLPGTIKRWRRELEETKQGTFLAIFAQHLIDMQEELKNSSSRPMHSERWRQIAENMLARIQP